MDRREIYLFITFCNTLQCVKHSNENAILLRLLVFGALMFQDTGLALDSITQEQHINIRLRSKCESEALFCAYGLDCAPVQMVLIRVRTGFLNLRQSANLCVSWLMFCAVATIRGCRGDELCNKETNWALFFTGMCKFMCHTIKLLSVTEVP